MIACRLAKLAMVVSIALFAFIVTYDNIVDYGSNYAFVQHVLSMDSTFPGNALMGRAITAPWAWTGAYWIIIGVEGLTCAAFAVAAVVSASRREAEAKRVAALRDDLIRQVLAAVPDAVLNGPPPGLGRLPGNAHFSFPGCEGDALLLLLDAKGIECSTGSACTAGVAEPSHVLLAMGADEGRARGSLRFSLGRTTTQPDVDALGILIGESVARARRASAR